MTLSAEVAIVGGGPSGAITAALLGTTHDVVLVERSPAWHWRACGVFTSPAGVAALRRVGIGDADLAEVARPIPAMRVETSRGSTFRLTYGARDGEAAAGLDRGRLDPRLLAHARERAMVREGLVARDVRLPATGRDGVSLELATGETLSARIVVGADGRRSVVAGAAGVLRPSPLGPRLGLTFHVADPDPGVHEARMVLIRDGYVGLAPVPVRRLNVGIVLGPSWFSEVKGRGAEAVAREIVRDLRAGHAGGAVEIVPDTPLDPVAGAKPVGASVRSRAGRGWLLVGDAAGFLDPFTGEGLHRAVVSAELASATIHDALVARTSDGMTRALRSYDEAMRSRFARKDLVTRVVQGFLARPALFEYAARRLAARDGVRQTMAEVIADLVPASRALTPRYLGALLRP